MPRLGLGANIGKQALTTPGIISDGLVLKSNFDTGAVTPISDGSVEFNGTSDYISFESKPIDTQPGTYCFWLKASETGGNKGLFGHEGQDKGAFHIQFSSGRPLIYLASGYYQYFDDTGLGDDGKWHHYAVHLDPTDISAVWLYIDGVTVAKNGSANASSGAGNAYGNLEIGRTDASNEFEGSLCNFGIWTGELTQAQIKSIMYKDYEGLTSAEKTNLVSWWSLDEVVDSTTSTGAAVVYDKVNASLEDTPTIDSVASSNSATTSTQLGAMNKDLVSGSLYKLTLTVAKEGRIDYHHNTSTTGSTVAGNPLTVGTHELYMQIDDSTVNRFLMIPYIEDQLSYIKLERILGNPGRLS